MEKLPDLKEEKKLWKKGYAFVIGVDEVGRGAFAGPVVAGAVIFQVCHPEPEGRRISEILRSAQNDKGIEIDDSKRLKPLERKRAALWIKKNCLAFGIGQVGVRTINRMGIGRATTMAMRKAIYKIITNFKFQILPMSNKNKKIGLLEIGNLTFDIPKQKIFVLVDAFHIKYLRGIGLKNQKAIKKGDQKSISIAAASILAKVYRDTLMQKLTKRYGKYHWGRNKGYGTKKHQEAILKNGSTTLHRKKFVETFLRNKSYATMG